jgi:hypothetical protein
LLGGPIIVLYVISLGFGAAYGIPMSYRAKRFRGRRRGYGVPMLPAISAAVPVTLLVYDAPGWTVIGLTVLMVVTFAVPALVEHKRHARQLALPL